MSNATAIIGAASDKNKRKDFDFYPTPAECTIALLNFLELDPMIVWEPACGDLAMSKVIESFGHTVISTDIRMGYDFLMTNMGCNAIITNPPFNKSVEFIEKSLRDARLVCMLLKSSYWHAQTRTELFKRSKPAFVLAMNWRPNFVPQSGNAPTMDFIWTVWKRGNMITQYDVLQKPVAQQKLF